MNTLATQLAALNLDFNDRMTVVEDEDERQDALGDLPNWDEVSMNDFILDYYWRTHKRTPQGVSYTKWHIIESKLGDGYWKGRPTWKSDAPTDSVNIVAAREMTMLKFLSNEEVTLLNKHITDALNAGDSPQHAAEAATQLVYEHARETRWRKLHSLKPQVENLLYAVRSKYSTNHFYATCLEMVAEGASKFQFLAYVQSKLQAKVYGRPYKYFNEMYWLVRFDWHIEEAGEIMQACATRYAQAISFFNTVHGD
jgi:hypothetical protein